MIFLSLILAILAWSLHAQTPAVAQPELSKPQVKAKVRPTPAELKKQLLQASAKGDEQAVTKLLGLGADPDSQDEDRYTALMLATMNGHTTVVQALLAKGADPNKSNKSNYTPLLSAEKQGMTEIVSLLKAAGATSSVSEPVAISKKAADGAVSGERFVVPVEVTGDSIETRSDVTVTGVGAGLVQFSGNIESAMVGFGLRQLVWNRGATHHLKGRIEFRGGGFEDYIFEGDVNDPLTFQLVAGIGYVYRGGKGTVTRKSTGLTVTLPPSNTPTGGKQL